MASRGTDAADSVLEHSHQGALIGFLVGAGNRLSCADVKPVDAWRGTMLVGLRWVVAPGVAVLTCAGCASAAAPGSSASPASASTASGPVSSTLVSPSASNEVGLGPPPCPLEPTTAFPWQSRPGGPAPYVLKRGQVIDIGAVLSSQPVAYTANLRIDVVPATADVIDGAGDQLTAGTEPHVLRLDAVKPAPGRYALTFQGLDEKGRPLPAGDYQVFLITVEATRRTVELGCLPATPPPTSGSRASSLPPDAVYSADGTEMLGTIHLID